MNILSVCLYMQEPDCPEELLKSEHSHLLSFKRSLEAHLRKIKFQLQVLNSTRSRLLAIIQERSRVTDLLCQSMFNGTGVETGRPRSSSFVKFPSSSLLPSGQSRSDGAKVEHYTSKGAKVTHSKACSAPVLHEIRMSCSEKELGSGK